MTMYLITAPTAEVVTLEEAKLQLRKQNTTEYDAQIQAIISAVVAQIDPAGGGWLGRAIRPQQWELRQNSFEYPYGDGIRLPYPPLISVDSITYPNGDGDDVVMVEDTDYRVVGVGHRMRSHVLPIYNGSWPSSVRADHEAVRILYTAGYADTPTDSLPPQIKQAVLLGIRDLWSLGERNLYLRSEDVPGLGSFEWTVSDNAGRVIREATENLLQSVRVYE